jgi:hypothetical protein
MRPVGERVPLADEIASEHGTPEAWGLADQLAVERDSAKCHPLWEALMSSPHQGYEDESLYAHDEDAEEDE